MKQPENMCKVRNTVNDNIGKKVKLMSNRGRNRIDIAEGVITKTYPFLFSIELESTAKEATRTISLSYTDILTNEVELVLC